MKSSAGAGGTVEIGGVIETTTVDVPLCENAAALNKDVALWDADEVRRWVAVANGGRFSHVVLPPGLTGRQLMSLKVGLSIELGWGGSSWDRQQW